ncbi:MAG TPA: hypothetical protein DF383_01175 [Deltaproteobacteria bacterium]|nr:hypothetical protein [Deltaproteobacteria bacterium]
MFKKTFLWLGIAAWIVGIFMPQPAAALSANSYYDQRYTLKRPASSHTPARFGYLPAPQVLPGTQAKRKCIPHGQARCVKRPTLQVGRYSKPQIEINYSNPILKTNSKYQR